MSTDLTCPKCQGPMRKYERNGIHIDQCTECRGIFLDRGELEHLIDAEAAYSPAASGSQAADSRARGATLPPAPQPPAYGWDQGGHHGPPGHGGQYGKRKKSFLSELFD